MACRVAERFPSAHFGIGRDRRIASGKFQPLIDMAKRIAVIGGGTSGLSAAYSLQKKKSAGAALEYFLFEAGHHFGGVIRTERIDDCVVEAGPDSFLTEKPWAADLCRELGIGDQLISSNDADRKTYMLVKGDWYLSLTG